MIRRFPWAALLALGLLGARGASAQERSLDELLGLSLRELAAIRVVSAQKLPGTVDQVPATVRVVTAEQIAENGYLTLEDALSDLPGFQFRNILGFNSYVFLRGIPSQNNTILLLVDGVQINELNSGGFYGGGQFNLGNVERIEVVYGPASALYGTNAIAGIVHVITRDPLQGSGGKLNAAIGSLETSLLDFRYSHHTGDDALGVSVGGMVKRTDKADLRGAAASGNWTNRAENFENDLSFDGRFRFKEMSAGLVLQDKDASRASVQRTFGRPVQDFGVNWHIRFLNAWARYVYERSGPWSARSTLYYRSSTVLDDTIPVIESATEVSAGRQFRWVRPGELVGNETQVSWSRSSRLAVSAGVVIERERLASGYSISSSDSATELPPAPASPPRVTNDLASLFAEARVAVSGELQLVAGLRHDDSTSYGVANTPRLGLVLHRDRLTAKLLYMEAFRAPKPWDFTDGLGSPDLRPEKMRSVEASVAYSISDHARADLTVFRGRLDGLLTRIERGDSYLWVNAGQVDDNGAELALELRKGRLKAWANASYNESIDASGRQVPEIARHGANLGASYTLSSRVTVGLRANYFGSRTNPKVVPTTGELEIDDALILHLSVSVRLPRRLEARLFVDNLSDVEYFHPSNLPPSRYPQPGRTARLQVGYSF